jgi:glycosyltransferase involved in cell wall biosynthesis
LPMIFSVAIPVFKQAEFLPTALASLRAQASKVQLAVMDATPDDSVQKVLAAYSSIVHYSRHGPDKGQSAAIQEGWDHTTGGIVYWLCADDYLFPYAFQEVEKIFHDRPDVDVVYGDSIFVNESGQFIRYFPSISSDIARIVSDCCISQPSCFVRRSAMERAGKLNPELDYIMDWDLWTRLFKSGAKFHYIRKPLSAVRIHEGTKTSSDSKRRFYEIVSHVAKHAGYISALQSLIGFYLAGLYFQELGRGKVSLDRRIVSRLLAALGSIKARHVALPASKKSNTLYGLDVLTNRVRGECEVHLPAYKSRPPASVVVAAAGTRYLNAFVNGIPSRRLSAEHSGPAYRQIFEVPVPQRSSQHHFHIALRSAESIDWKLISVHLE